MHYIIESLRDGHRTVAYYSRGTWCFIGSEHAISDEAFKVDWAIIKKVVV